MLPDDVRLLDENFALERRQIVQAGYIADLMLFALDNPRVRSILGGRGALSGLLSRPGSAALARPLCGPPGQAIIECSDDDIRFADGKRILTRQEVKILAWASANLDRSGRDIYTSLVAVRVFVGALATSIRSYRAMINSGVVLPALPADLALMKNLGVQTDEVPAWNDIVSAFTKALGQYPRGVVAVSSLLLKVLSAAMEGMPDARAYAEQLPDFEDRSGEVEDRLNGIAGTVPPEVIDRERPPGGSGGGKPGEGGQTPSGPRPRGPRPRGPRPKLW